MPREGASPPRARPLVSVGLPTYNRAHTLGAAIESILSQDCGDLELIISDNSSSDETPDLCERHAQSDSRVRYLRQSHNRGIAANFNAVAEAATGEFFMWLGDDDQLGAGYLSTCVDSLSAHADYALVSGQPRYGLESYRPREGEVLDLVQESPVERVSTYFREASGNGAFYGLMRRSLLPSPPLPRTMGGDWLLLAALAYRGKVRTLPGIHVNRNAAGASRTFAPLLRVYGLSARWEYQPYLYIALTVLRDLGWSSPVYRELGARRLPLALRAAIEVLRKSPQSPLDVLRARLLLRTRLRRWLEARRRDRGERTP